MPTSESNLTRSLMYLFEVLMSDILVDENAAKDIHHILPRTVFTTTCVRYGRG